MRQRLQPLQLGVIGKNPRSERRPVHHAVGIDHRAAVAVAQGLDDPWRREHLLADERVRVDQREAPGRAGPRDRRFAATYSAGDAQYHIVRARARGLGLLRFSANS